jgi:hypothetical protein
VIHIVRGTFLVAERCFPGDRPFDRPPARLDALDQADEIRDNRAIGVILVVGRQFDAVSCIPYRRTHYVAFRGALLLVR